MMKQCIFCGGRVNSKEDAWPQWLLNVLKDSPDEKVPMMARRYPEPVYRRWNTIHSAIKVKNVCGECNNGWMSQSEDEAKPILTPMILGKATTLTASQQLTIAAWLTKCAMVFDSMDKGEVFYDALDRLHFRDTLAPSLNATNVWLGIFYGASGLCGFTDHRTLRTSLGSGGAVKSHVHTMLFGHLVLQIVSIKRLVHEDRPLRIKMPGAPWNNLTVQIWPTNLHPVQWPPTFEFNESEQHLKLFANRFGGQEK